MLPSMNRPDSSSVQPDTAQTSAKPAEQPRTVRKRSLMIGDLAKGEHFPRATVYPLDSGPPKDGRKSPEPPTSPARVPAAFWLLSPRAAPCESVCVGAASFSRYAPGRPRVAPARPARYFEIQFARARVPARTL